MASEGQERDPRALPLASGVVARERRVGRPLGGGYGSSEYRQRMAVPHEPKGSMPKPLYTTEQQAQIAELFEKALSGELPRSRPLKTNEPERLNERHLAMVSMRATGLHQRLIAKAFGDNDLYVHQVLNHPDAVFLLSQLLAMRAVSGNVFQERMEALAEPAMSAIEDALLEDDPDTVKVALKRAPLAFRVLEQSGKIVKPAARLEGEVTHRFEASGEQMSLLRTALREGREIKDAVWTTVEVSEGREVREVPSSPVGDQDHEGDGSEADDAPALSTQAAFQEARLVEED